MISDRNEITVSENWGSSSVCVDVLNFQSDLR